MKMMVTAVKVIMVAGVMAIGVQPSGKGESNKEVFDLLCESMEVATGLWQTISYIELGGDEVDEIHQKETEMGKQIEGIIFGSKWAGSRGGLLYLPEEFTGKFPERKDVCGSNKTSDNMPSASDNLASAILCLCTPTTESKDDLCGLNIFDIGNWPSNEDVKKPFKKVWDGDEGSTGSKGVVNRCRGTGSNSLEEARKNLGANLIKLEGALNTTGLLWKKSTNCDGSSACANVTQSPTWMEKLKQFSEFADSTIALVQTLEEKYRNKSPPAAGVVTIPEATPELAPKATPGTELTSEPGPVMSNAPVETPKRETRKSPTPQTGSQPEPEKPAETPKDNVEKAEASQVPEPNDTSGSILTNTKWHLLVTLLI